MTEHGRRWARTLLVGALCLAAPTNAVQIGYQAAGVHHAGALNHSALGEKASGPLPGPSHLTPPAPRQPLLPRGFLGPSPAPAPLARSPSPASAAPVGLKASDREDNGVEQTVSQRIADDSHRIGLVAQRLVDVQDGIREVEHDVLNRVFDMSSMNYFFEQHTMAVEENKQLSKESAELMAKVASLAGQLNTARQQMDHEDTMHGAQSHELEITAYDSENQTAGLVKTLEHEKVVEQVNEQLRRVNSQLREQNNKSASALQAVREAVRKQEVTMERKRRSAENLEERLHREAEEAAACEARASRLYGQIGDVHMARAAAQTRASRLEMHDLEVYAQLERQNELLKGRLRKARANTATIQSQLVVTKEKFVALQVQGQSELTGMRGHLGLMRQKAEELENQLTANVQARQALEKEIRALEHEIQKLEQKLLSGELASIKANGTRLKQELQMVQGELQTSQTSMAKSNAQAAQVKMTLMQLRQTTQESMAVAQQVARAALSQAVTIRQGNEAARSRAEDIAMQAQSAQLSDCDGLWDKKHPQLLKDLEDCKQVAPDLEAVTAQVASLTSMASTPT